MASENGIPRELLVIEDTLSSLCVDLIEKHKKLATTIKHGPFGGYAWMQAQTEHFLARQRIATFLGLGELPALLEERDALEDLGIHGTSFAQAGVSNCRH